MHTMTAALLREALTGRRSVCGPKHPDTLDSIYNLGRLLQVWLRRAARASAAHSLAHSCTGWLAFVIPPCRILCMPPHDATPLRTKGSWRRQHRC